MDAPRALPPWDVADLVRRALAEDVRSGDITTWATVPCDLRATGRITARQDTVAAAVDVAAACFIEVEPSLEVTRPVADGEACAAGTALLRVAGPARGILTAERTALNVLQRACGIAAVTRRRVDAVAGLGVEILDTRKTAPGLRALDKHAVRCGGGVSHRTGLDDLVMIKDNHVVAAGSVSEALRRAFAATGHAVQVELEVDTLEQLAEALSCEPRPDLVLLDNFSPSGVREAVARVAAAGSPLPYVEVSGGVTAETLRSFAEAGPDGISLGELTHSVRAADLALDLELPP